MMRPLSEHVIDKLRHAENLYHRLVLVVGPAGTGKTSALQEVAGHVDTPLVNINLELSRRLLDLTERQRTLQLQRLLHQVVAQSEGGTVLLDNIEILFDVALRQNPLRLLQGLSRNRTIGTTWSGSIEDSHLVYAAPHHPEVSTLRGGRLVGGERGLLRIISLS
jgi:ABC-type hemin transport system ATPase subunit